MTTKNLALKTSIWLLSLLTVMPSMAYAGKSQWPSLPTSGFISGRAANEEDVKAGNAIFVAKVNGAIVGKPIAVPIPQFAYWTDGGTGHRVPIVVVQAEEANGMRLFGFRDISGADHVATGQEIELLGTTPPQ